MQQQTATLVLTEDEIIGRALQIMEQRLSYSEGECPSRRWPISASRTSSGTHWP